jgi:glycosyltransferase involved in cell wall biosynthesis
VTEALPSVITESMLSGLPFIATHVGGIPEQAGGFGYVLRSGTVDELKIALIDVLDRYESFADQAHAMSDYARSTFSIQTMLERHIQLYERVTQRPPRRNGRTALDRLVRRAIRGRGRSSTISPEAQQAVET